MVIFFFFNATATTEIYTLSLHDALPIYHERWRRPRGPVQDSQEMTPMRFRVTFDGVLVASSGTIDDAARSEEHTSELQSRRDLVCRLLLEKKKKKKKKVHTDQQHANKCL